MRVYDPMIVILGRMLVGSFIFLFFLRGFRNINFRKKDIKYLVLMAVCEPCIYFIFEARAIQLTTASQAGVITAILPLLVAIAARIFLKEYISKQTLAGFTLAVVGAVWLSVGGESTESAPNPILGNFYEFMAMVTATGYMIILKRLSSHYSAMFLTAVQAWVGAIFFSFFLFSPTTVLPTEIDMSAVLAIVYLGSAVTLGGYGLYNYGASLIPANQAAAYINLIPIFTVILGFLLLNESFTVPQYFAAALIFTGIYLSQKRAPKLSTAS